METKTSEGKQGPAFDRIGALAREMVRNIREEFGGVEGEGMDELEREAGVFEYIVSNLHQG